MEGPRPRYTPPFADAERAVCLLRPPKCPLRSHEHERATIARYARARGHHPPIHRTGSGALKTMERSRTFLPGDLWKGGPFVIFQFFFPYGQSPWPIFSQLAWQNARPETGPKGRDRQGRNGKPLRFVDREWRVLSRWIFPNRSLCAVSLKFARNDADLALAFYLPVVTTPCRQIHPYPEKLGIDHGFFHPCFRASGLLSVRHSTVHEDGGRTSGTSNQGDRQLGNARTN